MVCRQVCGVGEVPEEHDRIARLRYRPISLNRVESCAKGDFTAGQTEGIFSCRRFESHVREHVRHASMFGRELAIDSGRDVSEAKTG